MKIERVEFESDLDALVHLVKVLAGFEAKYRMSSEEFFDRYTKGDADDSVDSVEWAGNYRHYLSIKEHVEGKMRHVA